MRGPVAPIILFSACLFNAAAAVKLDDFKRCDQAGFCRRQRAWADWRAQSNEAEKAPFFIDAASVAFTEAEGKISARLIDRRQADGGNRRLRLDVQLLEEASC